jgi:arginyl-tRNA synthetase/DNA/RNA-binding domain of Phe-tRNA-synthetase-like protein
LVIFFKSPYSNRKYKDFKARWPSNAQYNVDAGTVRLSNKLYWQKFCPISGVEYNDPLAYTVCVLNIVMKIRLSPEIIEAMPGIAVHALVFSNLRNQKKISAVSQLLRGVIAKKRQELKNEETKKKIMGFIRNAQIDNKTINEAQLLKATLNKIGLGREIKSENPLKDLAHYLALKYVVPVFGGDLDLACKDFEIAFTVTRQGKRAEDVDFVPETERAVVWLVDIGSMPREEFMQLPEEFKKVILKYCGGSLTAEYTLDAKTMEGDLLYVSQREIEYQEEQKRLAEEKAMAEKILNSDDVPFLSAPVSAEKILLSAPRKPLKDLLEEAISESAGKYLAENNLVYEPDAEDVKTPLKAHDDKVERLAAQSGLRFAIETPRDPAHGDYASSAALKLAKTAGRPPREVAESLIKLLPSLDFVEKVEIAGSGFINFHLSAAYLAQELDLVIAQKEYYGRTSIGAGKKVVIEYSQPNIAKPLGVHHLLSTIIGQTLVNIFRFAGFKVTAINYLGDWGTQFGKLLYAYKHWGNEDTVKKDPLNELLKLYVRFHDEAEKDASLDDKGREEFKKLEEGDEENRRLWEWFRNISIEEIERLYKILGVKFDEYLGEAMYAEAGRDVIAEGLEKGLIEIGEKNALIVKFDQDKYPPFMVRKADGTTLYSTRDLASIKDRLVRYDHPDKIIYVVDVAQSLHFKQLFETARYFGYIGAEVAHAPAPAGVASSATASAEATSAFTPAKAASVSTPAEVPSVSIPVEAASAISTDLAAQATASATVSASTPAEVAPSAAIPASTSVPVASSASSSAPAAALAEPAPPVPTSTPVSTPAPAVPVPTSTPVSTSAPGVPVPTSTLVSTSAPAVPVPTSTTVSAPAATELVHVVFGRMQLPEGRMSTRKGEVILLDEVIKEAVSRTAKLIAEKSADLTPEEKSEVELAMAISAIKYNIISQNRETNITFDWNRMLSLEGNSGPYLEYALARAKSILRKASKQINAAIMTNSAATPASAHILPGTTTATETGSKQTNLFQKNEKQTDLFSLTEEILSKEEQAKVLTVSNNLAVSAPDIIQRQHAAEESSAFNKDAAPLGGTAANIKASATPATQAEEEASATPYGLESEKRLLSMIPKFSDYVEASVRDYKPNHLTSYLFDLARAFNYFYNEVPVLNAARPELKNSRIKLVKAFATVLENGLRVLGISVFEKM